MRSFRGRPNDFSNWIDVTPLLIYLESDQAAPKSFVEIHTGVFKLQRYDDLSCFIYVAAFSILADREEINVLLLLAR